MHDPRVQQDIDRGWKNYPKGFVAHLQPGDVPPGGKGLAEYLAKYVVSPPISIRRLEEYDGQQVRYWYQDHKTKAIQHIRERTGDLSDCVAGDFFHRCAARRNA